MLTMISEICGNKIIQTGAVAWVISQVIKTILHLIVNKKIVWERLGSPVFGVAVFMAIIVMHDARGVRRETGKQAVVINDMIELFEKMGAGNLTPEQTLKEFVGHTPMQVFAGGILGIIVALVMHM